MVNNQIPGPVDMGIANSYIALTNRPATVDLLPDRWKLWRINENFISLLRT
jgi:hypothetical protein